MPMKRNVAGFRVTVNVPLQGRYMRRSEEAARREAEHVRKLILRHVEPHSDAMDDAIAITEDADPVCEYCGRAWTEADTDYNGGCCARDEDNNPNPEEANAG